MCTCDVWSYMLWYVKKMINDINRIKYYVAAPLLLDYLCDIKKVIWCLPKLQAVFRNNMLEKVGGKWIPTRGKKNNKWQYDSIWV